MEEIYCQCEPEDQDIEGSFYEGYYCTTCEKPINPECVYSEETEPEYLVELL